MPARPDGRPPFAKTEADVNFVATRLKKIATVEIQQQK